MLMVDYNIFVTRTREGRLQEEAVGMKRPHHTQAVMKRLTLGYLHPGQSSQLGR